MFLHLTTYHVKWNSNYNTSSSFVAFSCSIAVTRENPVSDIFSLIESIINVLLFNHVKWMIMNVCEFRLLFLTLYYLIKTSIFMLTLKGFFRLGRYSTTNSNSKWNQCLLDFSYFIFITNWLVKNCDVISSSQKVLFARLINVRLHPTQIGLTLKNCQTPFPGFESVLIILLLLQKVC